MTFKQTYEGILRLMEYDPATWGGGAADQEEVADAITWRCRVIWENTMWSRLVEVNEETVTEDANGAKYVAWSATLAEEDDVWQVHTRNPRRYRNRGRLYFTLSPRGVELSSISGSTVWVEKRPRPLQFTRVAYDAGTAYVLGDVVYDATTGECYRCIQAGTGNAVTDTDYWTLQEIPDWMNEYIRRGAFADLLRNDGRGDRADVEEARAQFELERVLQVEEAQQDQHRKISVTV